MTSDRHKHLRPPGRPPKERWRGWRPGNLAAKCSQESILNIANTVAPLVCGLFMQSPFAMHAWYARHAVAMQGDAGACKHTKLTDGLSPAFSQRSESISALTGFTVPDKIALWVYSLIPPSQSPPFSFIAQASHESASHPNLFRWLLRPQFQRNSCAGRPEHRLQSRHPPAHFGTMFSVSWPRSASSQTGPPARRPRGSHRGPRRLRGHCSP